MEEKSSFDIMCSTSIRSLKERKKIIEAKTDTTLENVLQILAENNILSVPIRDKDSCSYLGFVDVLDVVMFIINMYTKGKDNVTEDAQWSSWCSEISTLSNRGKVFGKFPVSKLINKSFHDEFCVVYPTADIRQLIELFAEKKLHRVAVMTDDSSLINIKIDNIISQTDVVRFLFNNLQKMNPEVKTKSLADLKIGTRNVISMSSTALAIHGIYLMYYNKVSAIAVTTPSGELLANMSASEIRGLDSTNFHWLLKPIVEFLEAVQKHKQRLIVVSERSSLEAVITKVVFHRVHRVWLVNANHEPIGVISLTDIIAFFDTYFNDVDDSNK